MKVFLIILSVAASALAVDYCKICSNHIGCNNDGEINPKCRATSEMIADTDIKTYLTDAHNEKRNLVASGELPGYKPAARMATIEWDDELAYLAGLNVKTCEMAHDLCRNTETFKYSGQNLASLASSSAITAQEAAKNAVEAWFAEHVDADMSVIDSFHSNSNSIGHFTVMVADRNIRLGCAMIKTEDGMNQFVTACNYATTNMMQFPIYVQGATASKCASGTNPKYPALCSPSEQIDPNNFF